MPGTRAVWALSRACLPWALLTFMGCIEDRSPAAETEADASGVDMTSLDGAVVDMRTPEDMRAPDARLPRDATPDAKPDATPDAAPDAVVPVPDAAPEPDEGPPPGPIEGLISAGGPYQGLEGPGIEVRGSAEVEIVEWRWDLGDDGEIDGVGRIATLPTDDDGMIPLVLWADDADGNLHVARTTVNLMDLTPSLAWYPPRAVWVGEAVTLPPGGCAAMFPADPITAVEVDFGDGFIDAEAPLVHIWPEVGPAEMRLRCTDEDSSVVQPYMVDVRLRDRDGDGIEDALDPCPDHPRPFPCDGVCAEGFPFAEGFGADDIEANRLTNGRMVEALRRLPVPAEVRDPLVALASIPPGNLCVGRDFDCVTDADELRIASQLFDLLDRPELSGQERRCVDAALAFRLQFTEQRMAFVCGPFTFATGGMRAIRRLHPWLAGDLAPSRCHRAQLYNGCLVAAFGDINEEEPVPMGCRPQPTTIELHHRNVFDAGESFPLSVQCEDAPGVRWQVDWGDGLPVEEGESPDIAGRYWPEPGDYEVELTCWEDGAVAGQLIQVRVR